MAYEKCPVCEKVSNFAEGEQVVECRECGATLDFSDGVLKLSKAALKEAWENAKKAGDFSELSPSLINEMAANIVLTTTPLLAGKTIKSEIEIISAECVYGMHIFKDFFAGVRDIFGGRSKAIQDTLRDARKTAMAELRREALMVGADAVIGVTLDYHEVTGGGKNGMIMIVVAGTAVNVK